jgi:hypothetical protein
MMTAELGLCICCLTPCIEDGSPEYILEHSGWVRIGDYDWLCPRCVRTAPARRPAGVPGFAYPLPRVS